MPLTELLDERRHLVEVARWMLGSRVTAERVTDEAYRGVVRAVRTASGHAYGHRAPG
ncbi:hypothetical protein [Streptomyces sp. KL116D]|uniref:hypothetical protein n=1 Tax=Streptomyces sp. KL116D TaxID=3045152 RepID=UPI0035561C8C